METKQYVSSNPSVILTRQTCGQRLNMSAGSQRWALAFCFAIRICYKFSISKCRGESDLGLCKTSVLAKRLPLQGVDYRLKNVFVHKICQNSPKHSGIFFASTKSCAQIWLSPTFYSWVLIANLHVKIISLRSAFASRRHARALAACSPCQDHVWITTDVLFRFHKNKFDEMPCKLDSTENRHSFKKYPKPHPGRRTKFARGKSADSWNFFSEFWVLGSLQVMSK